MGTDLIVALATNRLRDFDAPGGDEATINDPAFIRTGLKASLGFRLDSRATLNQGLVVRN